MLCVNLLTSVHKSTKREIKGHVQSKLETVKRKLELLGLKKKKIRQGLWKIKICRLPEGVIFEPKFYEGETVKSRQNYVPVK